MKQEYFTPVPKTPIMIIGLANTSKVIIALKLIFKEIDAISDNPDSSSCLTFVCTELIEKEILELCLSVSGKTKDDFEIWVRSKKLVLKTFRVIESGGLDIESLSGYFKTISGKHYVVFDSISDFRNPANGYYILPSMYVRLASSLNGSLYLVAHMSKKFDPENLSLPQGNLRIRGINHKCGVILETTSKSKIPEVTVVQGSPHDIGKILTFR